jgi:antitoxin VapB
MALNIKNPEVERLIAELAILTGNTKTGAVGHAAQKELDRIKQEATGNRGAPGRLTLLLETGLPSAISDPPDLS